MWFAETPVHFHKMQKAILIPLNLETRLARKRGDEASVLVTPAGLGVSQGWSPGDPRSCPGAPT